MLPETVDAELHGDGPIRGQLERLREAYGVTGRVHISPAPPDPPRSGSIAIYPSRHNAATAPLSPGDASGGSVIVDDRPRSATEADRSMPSNRPSAARPYVVRSMATLLDAVCPPGSGSPPLLGDASRLDGQRVGIVTNYPTHYRVSLFNQLAERLDEGGASMRVFFTDADPNRRRWMQPEPSGFEHEFLRAVPIRGAATDVPLKLGARLSAFEPTCLVTGGFSPLTSSRVARFARRRGIPCGVWSGEIRTLPTAKSRFRGPQRRRLLRNLSFGIAYGYESGEYLREVAPGLPTVYGRNTVPFPSEPSPVRRETVEILAVSRAVPRKGLEILIEAVRLLGVTCQLTIAGGGPELSNLRRQAGGDRRIRLLGAVASDRIGDLYREADIFAFPTRAEPFGLVLVEAFAAGLAVVTSAVPGAVGDLAVPGRNCLLVTDHEPASWAAALRRVVEDRSLRQALGKEASATVRRRWTIEHAAGAMICGLTLSAARTRQAA
jgi:glycosyltransferase involved in cell wall biosynthesis